MCGRSFRRLYCQASTPPGASSVAAQLEFTASVGAQPRSEDRVRALDGVCIAADRSDVATVDSGVQGPFAERSEATISLPGIERHAGRVSPNAAAFR